MVWIWESWFAASFVHSDGGTRIRGSVDVAFMGPLAYYVCTGWIDMGFMVPLAYYVCTGWIDMGFLGPLAHYTCARYHFLGTSWQLFTATLIDH